MKTSNHDFKNDSKQFNSNESDSSDPKHYKVRHLNWKKPITYLGLVIAGAGITVSIMHLLQSNPLLPQPSQPTLGTTVTQPPVKVVTGNNSNFITAVVDKVGSAVVRIDSTRTVQNPDAKIFYNPLFQQFFGSQFPTPPSKEIVRGIGSGFI